VISHAVSKEPLFLYATACA